MEMNPGPTPASTEAMLKRLLVSVWTVFNVDIHMGGWENMRALGPGLSGC